MTNPNNTFLTPVGRIVGGSVYNKRRKNIDGDEMPEDQHHHVVMLALPKSDPGTKELVNKARQVARSGFDESVIKGQFSWKFYDGDKPEHSEKEGWPGHIVFAISDSNRFPCKVVGSDRRDIDPSTVKNGYWVRCAGDFKPNGKRGKPGIYCNLRGVQFIREDEELGGSGDFGPTVEQMFPDAGFDVVSAAIDEDVPF